MSLAAGERLTLIKRSAQALADERWSDIELTLRTFQIPEVELEGGDAYDHLVRSLAEGTDSALVSLHAHLYPDASTEPATTGIGPWKADHFRLFLSHAHEHREIAGEIRSRLLPWSVDTFVAHDIIEPSKEWEDEIESALGTADAIAALLTPEFVNSKWCDQEVGFCLARGIPLVPIMAGAMPHGFIGKFQGLRAEGQSAWYIAPRLFKILATHEAVRDKMIWPIVQRYVNSVNFDGTREAFDLLKTITAGRWTEQMIKAVEEEGPKNGQVSQAFPLNDSRPMPQAVSQYLDAFLDRAVPAASGQVAF
jgi:hypothetical protein